MPRTEEAISKAHQLKGKWVFLQNFHHAALYAATSDDCEKVRGGDSKTCHCATYVLLPSPLDDCKNMRRRKLKLVFALHINLFSTPPSGDCKTVRRGTVN